MTTIKLQCENELRAYLKAVRSYIRNEPKDKSPLNWWKSSKSTFPLLLFVYRKWFECLASSVPSERAFSPPENTVTTKRASMSDELDRDLVHLDDNIRTL